MFMEEYVLPVIFDLTSNERDRSGQLKHSTWHLQTAGCLSFPTIKEVVR